MEIITWIILGGLAGLLASFIVGMSGWQRIVLTSLLGVFGAILGEFIAVLLGGSGLDGLTPYSLLVATCGSVLLLGIIRAIRNV